jgi:hypothetical protein
MLTGLALPATEQRELWPGGLALKLRHWGHSVGVLQHQQAG